MSVSFAITLFLTIFLTYFRISLPLTLKTIEYKSSHRAVKVKGNVLPHNHRISQRETALSFFYTSHWCPKMKASLRNKNSVVTKSEIFI